MHQLDGTFTNMRRMYFQMLSATPGWDSGRIKNNSDRFPRQTFDTTLTHRRSARDWERQWKENKFTCFISVEEADRFQSQVASRSDNKSGMGLSSCVRHRKCWPQLLPSLATAISVRVKQSITYLRHWIIDRGHPHHSISRDFPVERRATHKEALCRARELFLWFVYGNKRKMFKQTIFREKWLDGVEWNLLFEWSQYGRSKCKQFVLEKQYQSTVYTRSEPARVQMAREIWFSVAITSVFGSQALNILWANKFEIWNWLK